MLVNFRLSPGPRTFGKTAGSEIEERITFASLAASL